MTKPANTAGDFARLDEGGNPGISDMARRLAVMLNRQIELLEAEAVTHQFDEEHVKNLLALAKTAQAMEALCNKSLSSENGDIDEYRDILEFRRQLEKKIDALGGSGTDEEAPG
ncbi:MAG: hypothetical protein ACR2O0_16005 [Rhizobiaceae bacterium]